MRRAWPIACALAATAACNSVLGIYALDAPGSSADAGFDGGSPAERDGSSDAPSDATLGSDASADAPAESGPDSTSDASADAQDASADVIAVMKDAGPPSALDRLAISAFAMCGVTSGEGGVVCWGTDSIGELGDGIQDAGRYTVDPVTVAGVVQATQVVAGLQHFCALQQGGGLTCWGASDVGETGLGPGLTCSSPSPVTIEPVGLLTAFEKGGCAVSTDAGTLHCWGYFAPDGQEIDNPTVFATLPVGAASMTGGQTAACGRFDDGTVRCWGTNVSTALGIGEPDAAYYTQTPALVLGSDAGVTRVVGGGAFACAVTASRALLCWGSDDAYQLGPNVSGSTSLPVDTGITHVVDVALGQLHACALFDDGGVSCWGANDQGQLGNGTNTGAAGLVHVPNLGRASAILAGPADTCAQLEGGVWCWGNNQAHQLGAAAAEAGAYPFGAFPIGW